MNRQLAKELWDIRKSSQCEANRHGEKSRGRNLWLWADSRNDGGRQRNCVQAETRSSLVALHLVAQADCRKITRTACCGVRRFSCEIETDYFVEKRAILGHYGGGVVELCCDEDDQWSDGGDQPEYQDAVAPGLRFPRRRLFASHTLCAPRVKTQTCRMRHIYHHIFT